MFNYLKRFYYLNFYPRYQNLYGMELYEELDVEGSQLLYAYGDYSKGLFREGEYSLDEAGVFVFIDSDLNRYYNPCGVAEYALVCWGRMIDDKQNYDHYKKAFMQQIAWIVNNYKEYNGNSVVWYYNYPNQKPFFSGIAQGMIISALLRAYQLNKNDYYFQLALKSYNFLNTKVSDGGVLSINPPFCWWYEEYLELPKILNGHIYALLGIWDLYRVSKDQQIKESFDKGITDIKRNIKKFDLGFFTKYDAYTPYPANNSYHYTHITLFAILYQITKDSFFDKYVKKFQKYHLRWYYKSMNFIYLLLLSLKDKLLRKDV